MFTGLIQKTAIILGTDNIGNDLVLRLKKSRGTPLKRGESIAVDGACLTVSKVGSGFFECTLMPETLRATKFGRLVPPLVNLERPLRLNDLVGGHLVSGHIDTTGEISKIAKSKNGYYITVKFPKKFAKRVIDKGSIAIDGISLTVASCASASLTVAIIPLTLTDTTLGGKKIGDVVNLEFDLVGKYATR